MAFNEAAYLAANPDVAKAVAQGAFNSGLHHYETNGKYEGRPLAPASAAGNTPSTNLADIPWTGHTQQTFNDNAYLAANPDVAEAVRNGIFSSGWEHYQTNGIHEGRGFGPMAQEFNGNVSSDVYGDNADDLFDDYMRKYSRPTTPGSVTIPEGTEERLRSGGGTGTTFNPSSFNFDLPQYSGPLAAPITEGMFSALQGIKNTANANPIGMTEDVTRSISSMLSGDGFAGPGMDPNQVMSRFRPQVAGLDEAAKTGFQTMDKFNPTDLSGFTDTINSFRDPGDIFTDTSGVQNNIDSIRNNQPQVSDLSGFFNSLNNVRNNNPGVSDFSRVNRTLDRVGENIAPTNTGRSDAVLNSILTGGANANVDPRTRAVQDNTVASLNTALSAPRFDNTRLFEDMRTVFESDLADQTAELQEQFSSLGLAPGSTDRLNRIASNAGNARARFGVGMGEIASRSFEAAEGRRLGAIDAAGGVNDMLQTGVRNAAAALQGIMANERLPFEEKMRQREQLLATLPAEIQAAVIPVEQRQQNRAQDISMLPMELQAAQIPFEQQMDVSQLLASLLPVEMANSQIPFEQQMGVRNQFLQTLPFELEAATRPFEESMEFARNVLEPAAGRRMAAVGMDADLSDAAMNRYMTERNMAENARQAALQASVATRGQDISQQEMAARNATNLFNVEAMLRGTADDEALRAYQEFVRTQGGGLQQMLGFLNQLPEGTVSVGPSTASQVGMVAGQIVNNLPELVSTGKVIWDAGRKIWDWVT